MNPELVFSKQQPLGLLGAGQMARALARGWITAGLISAEQLAAADISDSALAQFQTEVMGAQVFNNSQDLADYCPVMIMAVKPNAVQSLLSQLQPKLSTPPLLVSIAAGITLSQLQMWLPAARWVRVMPNTPCLIGAGAIGYAGGERATAEDLDWVQTYFSAVGLTLRLAEAQLDAVTALSGSGPAYVFLMIEALSDGGVQAGLPRPVATQLAAQTLLGAARLVLETGQHPGTLKDMVTSPAGTTIAGLAVLEAAGVRGSLMAAVQAAAHRAEQLRESVPGISK